MIESFRAWNEELGEMLPDESQSYARQVYQWLHQGQPIKIMRGLGLLDVNGKEIYDGDIVKWDDGSEGRYWRVAIVKAKQDIRFECFDSPTIKNSSAHGHTFKFGSFIYTDTENHLHVIGNIYENPELLPPAK